MNDTLKFQITLLLTVPLGILSIINQFFMIPLGIVLGISFYFINRMNKLEKIIARYYLAGVIALIIPIILVQNPYYILLTELIIYFILMIVKNMLPKRMQVKIIETTKKHTIIEVNKSFTHPFAQGLYAVKPTKKKGIQTIKWQQQLFGSPKLTDFE